MLRRGSWLLLVVALAASTTSCTKTTAAGLVLVFDSDGTLDPDSLHVTITSSDGTVAWDWCYPIASSATFFPTTLAIASDGNPMESFSINASVSRDATTLDVRQNRVTEVPTDHVGELHILFSARCTDQVSSVPGPAHGTNCPYGVGVSLCPANETCDPSTGSCVSDAVPPPPATVPAVTEPPSCAEGGHGRSDCGSTPESCCTPLNVAGGTYYRTYTNDGTGPTGEADPATVSSFQLDKYDVTVGRFRAFVAAWNGGWTPAAGAGKHTYLNGGQGLADIGPGGGYEPGWNPADDVGVSPTGINLTECADPTTVTWTATPGANEWLPINCVNWPEAYAFCIWDGAFLPSEAEWEYAAAGGSEQREYPWGSTDPGTANQFAIYGSYYNPGCTGASCFAPVGSAPSGAGRYGQLDLAGNAWNWTLDWYSGYAPCSNCADVTQTGAFRVARGGAFNSGTADLLPPVRNSLDRYFDGIRCARPPASQP